MGQFKEFMAKQLKKLDYGNPLTIKVLQFIEVYQSLHKDIHLPRELADSCLQSTLLSKGDPSELQLHQLYLTLGLLDKKWDLEKTLQKIQETVIEKVLRKEVALEGGSSPVHSCSQSVAWLGLVTVRMKGLGIEVEEGLF